ncbi:unnamed protein product [Tetraodon nigroviridis]|uniref:(spotted green pufferfish) hypothetical protein n=1 Tax=Tetraodon nigroviridis TaxID=99883 RepID=Q4SBW7_TETNG|nr:unnamed protein product [Tetraodon nigroviridis]
MVMKQGKDGKRQEFPAGTPTTSRDLFCHPTTLAPTSAAPRGEDVSEDVLETPDHFFTCIPRKQVCG